MGVGFVGSVQSKPVMVLDPLDDTVRRVADAVFVVAAMSGLLALGMAPVCKFGALLAAIGLSGLYMARLLPALTCGWQAAFRALTVLGLALGLLLPAGYGLGGSLGTVLTADRLKQAEARLRASKTEVEVETEALRRPEGTERLAPERTEPLDDKAGIPERMGRMFGSGVAAVGDTVSAARESASRFVGQVWSGVPNRNSLAVRGDEILTSSIDIMAVYALRLLVFPLLSIFILYVCARAALSGGRGAIVAAPP